MWPRWNFPLFFSSVLTIQMLDVYASCAMGQSVIIIIMTQTAFFRHVAGCLLTRFTQRARWFVLLWFIYYGLAACCCVRISCIYAGRSMINSYGPSGSVLPLHLCCCRLGSSMKNAWHELLHLGARLSGGGRGGVMWARCH